MDGNISRREFLKLGSMITAGTLSAYSPISIQTSTNKPNIIIIVFDAMSALNLSLYGYGRITSPFISKFADECTVYHSHYAASNFTSSGTASLLTGMLPWKHRAITQGSLIDFEMANVNPFSLLGKDYYTAAFSQNFWPDRLVGQFFNDVDRFLPQTAFSMRGNNLVKSWVGKDRPLASIAFDDFLFPAQVNTLGSSILGYIYKSRVAYGFEFQRFQPGYPLGTPEVEGYFLYQNEVVIKGITSEIKDLQAGRRPFVSYYHLFSPHAPYRPSGRFLRLFDDALKIPDKQMVPEVAHLFVQTKADMHEKRKLYDQQISQLDSLFGRMVEELRSAGVLENSYIIVTSDHGELFERGYIGHGGIMMYEPVIRSPLLIRAPGQKVRVDISVSTSSIDVLPTLLSVVGNKIPPEVEGRVLPGFGGEPEVERPIFSVFAWENSAFEPIKKGVITLRKNQYKLIAYIGYGRQGENVYELYDLDVDPDEQINLVSVVPVSFTKMKEELLDNLSFANAHFVN